MNDVITCFFSLNKSGRRTRIERILRHMTVMFFSHYFIFYEVIFFSTDFRDTERYRNQTLSESARLRHVYHERFSAAGLAEL